MRFGEQVRVGTIIAILAVGLTAAIFLQPILIGIPAGIAFLLLAALRVDALVYTLVFCLPISPLLRTDLPIHDVSTVLRLLLFAGVFVAWLARGKAIRQWIWGDKFNVMVIAFGVVAALSLLVFNESNTTADRSLFRLFSYLAFYFAIIGWVQKRDQLIKLLGALLLSTIVVALYAFYQAAAGGYGDVYFRIYPLHEVALEPWVGRVTSFLFHFNSLAGYLNLVLPFAIVCSIVPLRPGIRLAARISWAAGSVALVMTQSRGGLIAYAGVLFLAIWHLAPNRNARNRGAVALASALLLLIPLLGMYSQRLESVEESTALSRVALWAAAGSMFLSNAIIGVGYGNYMGLYADFTAGIVANKLDAHNLYLQLLAETGIIGFAVFSVIVLWALRRSLEQMRAPTRILDRIVGFGVLGAMVGLMIHGFVDYLFDVSPQFGALFWLVLAILVVNNRFRNLAEPKRHLQPAG